MVKSKNDLAFDGVVYAILLLVLLVTLVPVLYVISVSLTPYSELLKSGGFMLIPRSVTFNAYKEVLADGQLYNGMIVTLKVTIFGTLANLAATLLMAYPLSRRGMPGGKIVTQCVVFTMLFSAGTVPTYLMVKATGLLDTLSAMIVPGLISVFNLVIMKTFFENLPEELFEAARIDGCNEFSMLTRIVMPMSLPILLTIGMYYAVAHWNAYMVAVLYITKDELRPMQMILRRILMKASNDMTAEEFIPTETLKMAAVCFSTAPIIVVYPFIQKYFVKGTLAGAVKG